MALNKVTVTWNELDAAVAPLGGSVSFLLSSDLADSADGEVIRRNPPKVYDITSGGGQSSPLVANDNANAVPSGTYYTVTVAVTGQPLVTFTTQINFANGSTQTLAFLQANAALPAAQYAQYLPLTGGTLTGQLTVPDLSVSGLTGAIAASRHVGATAGGPPVSGTFAVGDFVIDQTGAIFLCTVAGSPGTWTQFTARNTSDSAIQPIGGGASSHGSWGPVADAAHVHGSSIWTSTLLPGAGEVLFPRPLSWDSIGALASGSMALTFFTALRSETISHVFTETSGTAASGLTTAAIGIYSVDGSGNLTLVAHVTDLTLWAASYNLYTRALTASWSKAAGQLYAVGFLQIGTTPASLSGFNASYGFMGGNAAVTGLGQQLFGAVAGLSSLPSSVSAASVAQAYYGYNAALLA